MLRVCRSDFRNSFLFAYINVSFNNFLKIYSFFLTLSWPAGHICPAGHERIEGRNMKDVLSDSTSPFLYSLTALLLSCIRWQHFSFPVFGDSTSPFIQHISFSEHVTRSSLTNSRLCLVAFVDDVQLHRERCVFVSLIENLNFSKIGF